MSEIKTLTVNGKTYTVADPDAAHIDDSAVGANAWSSGQIAAATANALKGTVTGNVVCIRDASPLAHEMVVQLTSETITDFSSASVTKRGFNWFDQDTRFAQLGYVKQEDGSWLGDTYHGTLTTPPVQVQGAVYIQATVKNTGLRGVPLSLKASYTDGTIQTLIQVTADMTEFTRLKGVSQENKTLKHIQITYGGDATVTKGAFYICNVMMSYADGEYVPYTAETQVFASNADGTVKGISGNGEPMTLVADSDVTITAQYNKDTNKVVESLVQAIISLGGNV